MVEAPVIAQTGTQPQSQPIQPAVTDTPPEMPLRMSAEEFLRWQHRGIAEWISGEIIIMSVKYEHQRIVDFLNAVLRLFAQVFNLGIICTAPYSMRVTQEGNIRGPDLMFVSSANMQRITSSLLEGPADLVIEVVSEGSVEQDYDAKYIEYQNGGVREYWVIDPRADRLRTSFFVLDANNRFRPVPLDNDGIYRSTILPRFWLKTDWLWQDPLPAVDDLLLEIGGNEYAQHLIERLRQRGLLAR